MNSGTGGPTTDYLICPPTFTFGQLSYNDPWTMDLDVAPRDPALATFDGGQVLIDGTVNDAYAAKRPYTAIAASTTLQIDFEYIRRSVGEAGFDWLTLDFLDAEGTSMMRARVQAEYPDDTVSLWLTLPNGTSTDSVITQATSTSHWYDNVISIGAAETTWIIDGEQKLATTYETPPDFSLITQLRVYLRHNLNGVITWRMRALSITHD